MKAAAHKAWAEMDAVHKDIAEKRRGDPSVSEGNRHAEALSWQAVLTTLIRRSTTVSRI